MCDEFMGMVPVAWPEDVFENAWGLLRFGKLPFALDIRDEENDVATSYHASLIMSRRSGLTGKAEWEEDAALAGTSETGDRGAQSGDVLQEQQLATHDANAEADASKEEPAVQVQGDADTPAAQAPAAAAAGDETEA